MGEKLGGETHGKCGNLLTFAGHQKDIVTDVKVKVGSKESEPLNLNKTIKLENDLSGSQNGSIEVIINGKTLKADSVLSRNADVIEKPEDVAVLVLTAEPVTREMMEQNYLMYGKPGESKGGYEYENTIWPWENRKDFVMAKSPYGKQKYIRNKPGGAPDMQKILDYHWDRKNVTMSDISSALGYASAGLLTAGLILLVIGTVGIGGGVLAAGGVARGLLGASTFVGIAHIITKEEPTMLDALTLGHGAKIKAMSMLIKEANAGLEIINAANGLVITGIGMLTDNEKERIRNDKK